MFWLVLALILIRTLFSLLKKKFGKDLPIYIVLITYLLPAVIMALIIGYWIFQIAGWLGLVVYGIFLFYLIPAYYSKLSE